MSEFHELPYEVQNEIRRVLTQKIRDNPKHLRVLPQWNDSFMLYSIFAIDSWIDCNRLNLLETEWMKEVETAEI